MTASRQSPYVDGNTNHPSGTVRETNTDLTRAAVIFAAGAALTGISGAVVQLVVQPSTSVSDAMWRYPWTSGAFVPVSLLYALLHVLVVMASSASAAVA